MTGSSIVVAAGSAVIAVGIAVLFVIHRWLHVGVRYRRRDQMGCLRRVYPAAAAALAALAHYPPPTVPAPWSP